MSASPVRQTAGFVPRAGGFGFRLVTEPAGSRVGTVVAVHAFAEEMNKSRRMCARMARAAAERGWRVVQRDLAGCGDSSGDFADATWSGWADDVRSMLSDVDADEPVWLWCVRAGALLAPAALEVAPRLQLLLWQPVLSGAQHLQQFLRLQAGARVVGSSKAAGAVSPAQRLRSGAAVEIAGYELSPALAEGLGAAQFDVPAGHAGRIAWLEVTSGDELVMSPGAQRAIDRLRAGGVAIDAQAVAGPAFWQTQEIEECEALLAASLARLASAIPVGAVPETAP